MRQLSKKEVENKKWICSMNRGHTLVAPNDDNPLNIGISIKTENLSFGYRVVDALNFVSGLSNEALAEIRRKYGNFENMLSRLESFEKNNQK